MDLLGDIGFGGGDAGGNSWSIGGGYDPGAGFNAGALGQYTDMSQGMPEFDPSYYGQDFSQPGVLEQLGMQGTPVSPADYGGAPSGSSGQTAVPFGGGQSYARPDAGLRSTLDDMRASPPERQNPLMRAIGAPSTSDGSATDWTDPKTIIPLIKALGVGGNLLSQIMGRGKQANAQSAQQLQQSLRQNPYNEWNPIQAMRANQFFTQQYTPAWQRAPQGPTASPIVPSRGYAEGGPIDDQTDSEPQQGALGLVATDGMGQGDDVPINVSGGEYVFPADVVSDLGDGNNAAGAKALDEWVQEIRKRSRSTGPEENPPPAQAPADYLNQGE